MMTVLFKGAIILVMTGLVSLGIVELLTDKENGFLKDVMESKQEAIDKTEQYGAYVILTQFSVAAVMAIVWVIMLVWNFGDILKSLGAGCP